MHRSIAITALIGALLLFLPSTAAAQDSPFASCDPADVASQSGLILEEPSPGVRQFTLTGDVRIPCQGSTLFADKVTYDSRSQEVVAVGHVTLHQPDLTLYAERAVLNRATRLGTFYAAQGWARIGDEPSARDRFGTMEPDVQFYGEEIAKTGPKTYRIKNGGFTSCVQATPRWEMTTSQSTITLDKHALLRNVVLRVKDVPLLYIPVIFYPINKEDRATGFLLPQYGSSTVLGTSLSNAFFLVLGRSQDATFYHDWYSKGGQGLGTNYRYASSGDGRGEAAFRMMNLSTTADSTGAVTQQGERWYQLNANVNHALPRQFRAYGTVDYFSKAGAQQLHQNIDDFSRRTRNFRGALNGRVGRFRLDTIVDQRDIFYGTTTATRQGTAPKFSLAMADKPIGRSKVYFGVNGEAGYIVRQDNLLDPATDRSLWRFDGDTSLRAPLSSLPFLTATGEASWRLTRWLESRDPVTGLQVPVPLTRQMFELTGSVVGPVLARVFLTPNNGYADGFKHLIEPRVTVQQTMSPFDGYDRTVANDHIDTVLPKMTSVNYSLANRVLARRRPAAVAPGTPPPPGIAREILSVNISQTYYTSSRGAAVDPQYQSAVEQESKFSAISVQASSQPIDGATAEFRMYIHPKYRAITSMNASGTIGSQRLQLNAGWSKTRLFDKGVVIPNSGSQFLNATSTVRTLDNRVGGTYSFHMDLAKRAFVQQRIVASYNTQCCGVSFDWQSITSPFLLNGADRRFGVSFTLAGIGSFSNPLGSFGGQ